MSPPGKAMNRDTFPEAVLNGQQLDLFALYREVATRGGFKCAARGPTCIRSVTLTLHVISPAHACFALLFTSPSVMSTCMLCTQSS